MHVCVHALAHCFPFPAGGESQKGVTAGPRVGVGLPGSQGQGQVSHEQCHASGAGKSTCPSHWRGDTSSAFPGSLRPLYSDLSCFKGEGWGRGLSVPEEEERSYALVQIHWGLQGGEGRKRFIALLEASSQVTILRGPVVEKDTAYRCG